MHGLVMICAACVTEKNNFLRPVVSRMVHFKIDAALAAEHFTAGWFRDLATLQGALRDAMSRDFFWVVAAISFYGLGVLNTHTLDARLSAGAFSLTDTFGIFCTKLAPMRAVTFTAGVFSFSGTAAFKKRFWPDEAATPARPLTRDFGQ